MEWLKLILGEEKYNEVESKIKSELPKHFVAKDQYKKKTDEIVELQGVQTELETANNKLKEMNTTIEELKNKSGDSVQLKADLDKITTDYDTYKAGEETRISDATAKIKKTSAAEKLLLSQNVPADMIAGLMATEFTDMNKYELDDSGNIKGSEELIKTLKESKPSYFPAINHQTLQPNKDWTKFEGTLSREQTSKLTDEQYYKAKEAGKIE